MFITVYEYAINQLYHTSFFFAAQLRNTWNSAKENTCQTAGIAKIDVREMDIDLLTFKGYKSLLGPTGIGGSYVAENVPIRTSHLAALASIPPSELLWRNFL